MEFFHGIKTSEIDTAVVATAQTTAGLPVVIGTAPVHLASDPKINEPVICYSWTEAVKYLGYHENWDKYSLCEAMYAEFKLFAVAPVVFINVLNPAKHKKSVASKAVTVANKTATIADDVILSSLTVSAASSGTAAKAGTDYTAAYDDDGNVLITLLKDGALASATSVYVAYDAIDTSLIKDADIIGGVGSDDTATGLELIDMIYPKFSLVPGLLAAPGWSQHPEVAAVMEAKSKKFNSLFSCTVLLDIDTMQVKSYSGCNMWKTGNGYTHNNEYVGWPMGRIGDHCYYMSTLAMGRIGQTDADNDDVPYESPSNKTLPITGLCLKDGTEVTLDLTRANLLNSQGIVTALTSPAGWVLWGNYTGAYPSTTDPKDVFLCVRRMFDWDDTVFVLTYWNRLDKPGKPRNIKTILDSERIRLNGLISREYILGGSIDFLEEENPTTDLEAGIFRFHKKRTPPVPMQEIDSISEYDTAAFTALFE